MQRTNLKLVFTNPRPAAIKGSLRPFRLWNAKTGTFLPHRCFGLSLNAHKAAHWEANFVPVGTTIEVLNVEKANSCRGQYTHTPTGVKVWWPSGEYVSLHALRNTKG